jgi:D-glycero-alpha-D-manno-heptose-7-phosphate kinase
VSRFVRAKAPLRVSFAGGGTDVPPFPQTHGGAVLSATIDKWANASVRSRDDHSLSLRSLDYGQELTIGAEDQIHFDGRLDLPKAALLRMMDRDAQGIDVFLHSTAAPGSGLGASSAMIVAILSALANHNRVPMTVYEIAMMAYALEREDLGIRGGYQDHFAAAFGGFNYMEFNSDHVVVNPLRVDEATLSELEQNLLLVYTGQTRLSDHIIADQTERLTAGNPDSLDSLLRQRELARQMKDTLLRGRVGDFGCLLDAAWQEKQRMSPRIVTPQILEAYQIARGAGALGGKVTGAGGGGYMVFYCEYERRHLVAQRLIEFGMACSDVTFTPKGVTTWRADG